MITKKKESKKPHIPGSFPDKVTPDVDFIELVVQYDVLVVNNTILEDRNIQMVIENKVSYEYLAYCFWN